MSLMEKYKELATQINKLTEERNALGLTLILGGAADLFEKYPTIESVTWMQGGPDMSDGDFTAAYVRDDFDITTTDGTEYEYVSSYSESGGDVVLQFASGLREIFAALDDDVLFAEYGENVKVTVSRDGSVETNEYYPW